MIPHYNNFNQASPFNSRKNFRTLIEMNKKNNNQFNKRNIKSSHQRPSSWNGFKDIKVHNELPPIKENYKQSNNNDKENENKNQLFSAQTHFFERDKNNNMNFLYKKKSTPRNKVIKKSAQNSIRRQKIEIDTIENNNKPDYSINNFSKTQDSFYKQNKRYEFGGFEGINFNYNTNQNNNYESQFDYKKFKNKETKNENVN